MSERRETTMSQRSLVGAIEAHEAWSPYTAKLSAHTRDVMQSLPPALYSQHGPHDVVHMREAMGRLNNALGGPVHSAEHIPQSLVNLIEQDSPRTRQVYSEAYQAQVASMLVTFGLESLLPTADKSTPKQTLSQHKWIDAAVQWWGNTVNLPLVGSMLYDANRQFVLASSQGRSTVPAWIFQRTSEHNIPRPSFNYEDISGAISPPQQTMLGGIQLAVVPRRTRNYKSEDRITNTPAWCTHTDSADVAQNALPLESTLVISGQASAHLLSSPHSVDHNLLVIGQSGLAAALSHQARGWVDTATITSRVNLGTQLIDYTRARCDVEFDALDTRTAQMMYAAMRLWGAPVYSVPHLDQLRAKIGRIESRARTS